MIRPVLQLLERDLGIDEEVHDHGDRRAGDPGPAHGVAELGQLRPMVLPERRVAPCEHASRERAVVVPEHLPDSRAALVLREICRPELHEQVQETGNVCVEPLGERCHRAFLHASVREDLVDETKIGLLQEFQTRFIVGVQV